MPDESALPPLLLDAAGVAAQLSIGTRTLWRWISTGEFPPPDLSIGAKVRRWRRETVITWINKKAACANGGALKDCEHAKYTTAT